MDSKSIKKELGAWNILFSSANNKPLNLFCFFLFMLNTFLNLFNAVKAINKAQSWQVFFIDVAFFWLVGLLFLLRLFFNKNGACFPRTLPCSKKLYTRNISVLVEAVNLVVVIFVSVVSLHFAKSETGSVTKNPDEFCTLVLFCCIHILYISVTFPFIIRFISKEPGVNSANNLFVLNGFSVVAVEFLWMFAGGLLGFLLTLCRNFFIFNWVPALTLCFWVFVLVCASFVITACALNRALLRYVYDHLRM